MMLALLCVSAALTTVVLTAAYRAYAVRRRILDLPNERSSHVVPTPRGGGVAFVVVFLAHLLAAQSVFGVSKAQLAALAGAGASMAVVGLVDDHGHIAAGWRLLAHFAAAIWALACLGGDWVPGFFGASTVMLMIGYVVSAFGIVWLLNLYNFMDGIDGIAALETITVCIPGAVLWHLARPTGAWPAPLLLAACAAGFLVWNRPPARIFMGDSGSNFLGVVVAVFGMSAAADEPRLMWAWGILLGSFIVDATITLMRRLAKGERVHQAHRSHAYQHAARRHGHARVSLATAAINLGWLFPMAAVVSFGWLPGYAGVGLAYTPLAVVVLRSGAGLPDRSD